MWQKRLVVLKSQVRYALLSNSFQKSFTISKLFYHHHHRLLINNCLNHKCNFSKSSVSYTFKGVLDRYNGVTVETLLEPCEENIFPERLDDSLVKWDKENRKCIWFKVNIAQSTWVPILAKRGFNFHHARDDFVMMYKWLLRESKPNLPPSAYTNLGVGGLVINQNNEMLVISEKHYEYPHWKLPGGYVEKGEDLVDAAIREVKEETGVDTVFRSLVTFRHTHNMMFGNADIYVIVRMDPTSHTVTISNTEVNNCQWMPVEEYTKHEHVHRWNRFVVNQALQLEKMKIKMNLCRSTEKWGQNIVRQINYLIVENHNE